MRLMTICMHSGFITLLGFFKTYTQYLYKACLAHDERVLFQLVFMKVKGISQWCSSKMVVRTLLEVKQHLCVSNWIGNHHRWSCTSCR